MIDYMAGVKAFKKARKANTLSYSSTSNAVVVFDNGSVKVLSGNQACYAGLSRLGDVQGLHIGPGEVINSYPVNKESKVRPEYVLGGIQEGHEKLSLEVKLYFLDWVLNKSVYSETFVTKDPEWCLENGCVVATARVPANLMVGGLVAIRHMWEYSHRIYTFYHLCQAGVQPELAFWIGNCCVLSNNYSVIIFDQAYDSNHDSINANSWGAASLLNWLKGTVVGGQLRSPYRDNLQYRGYCGLFTPTKDGKSVKEKYLMGIVLPKESGGKRVCINPFQAARVKREEVGLPFDSVVKHIAGNLQYTIYEEVGYAKSTHRQLKSAI